METRRPAALSSSSSSSSSSPPPPLLLLLFSFPSPPFSSSCSYQHALLLLLLLLLLRFISSTSSSVHSAKWNISLLTCRKCKCFLSPSQHTRAHTHWPVQIILFGTNKMLFGTRIIPGAPQLSFKTNPEEHARWTWLHDKLSHKLQPLRSSNLSAPAACFTFTQSRIWNCSASPVWVRLTDR